MGGDLTECARVCGGKGGLGVAQVRRSPESAVSGGGRQGKARRLCGGPGLGSEREPPLGLEQGLGEPALAEGVAVYLFTLFRIWLSGPRSAREAEKPMKSSGYDLPGCVGRDPSACGQESYASARELIVVG